MTTIFSDDFTTYGHIYGFKTYKHNDDSEIQSTILKTLLVSSVRVNISNIDNNEEKEEQKDRKSIPSRKLNSYDDIHDILHDYI
ncbi:hypothetical protein N7539_003139 [Penicillium diatomitis]|uniref:Uncharacterized protein n=1 Tax=Penicillium diatomitis TaxID=2819901 RepID=A0A9W9XH87_9EURO|nr:uncharacterized protein N7539_003139 [Penicillium diatomitis]KAJ5491572.1 hypothetical protein N7539_003139 [Penicillium diatomitis]